MEYKYNKKENKFTENGHTMFMEDVLQRLKRLSQLASRIKELENNTTELITEEEDYYGAMTNITKTKCCGIGPITNENFCPNCGRKIIRN